MNEPSVFNGPEVRPDNFLFPFLKSVSCVTNLFTIAPFHLTSDVAVAVSVAAGVDAEGREESGGCGAPRVAQFVRHLHADGHCSGPHRALSADTRPGQAKTLRAHALLLGRYVRGLNCFL